MTVLRPQVLRSQAAIAILVTLAAGAVLAGCALIDERATLDPRVMEPTNTDVSGPWPPHRGGPDVPF